MPMIIIDNKKVDLTADEVDMYHRIVRSYTSITNRGEDLFINLFETDAAGIIIFLKPPSTRQTSFEVFLFLMAVMQHQHIRIMQAEHKASLAAMQKQVDDLCNSLNGNLKKKKKLGAALFNNKTRAAAK